MRTAEEIYQNILENLDYFYTNTISSGSYEATARELWEEVHNLSWSDRRKLKKWIGGGYSPQMSAPKPKCICGHQLENHVRGICTDSDFSTSGSLYKHELCPCNDGRAASHLSEAWCVRLICCGRDDGTEHFPTWEEADAFRNSYASGPGVDPHGYSGGHTGGHQRAAIISAHKAA